MRGQALQRICASASSINFSAPHATETSITTSLLEREWGLPSRGELSRRTTGESGLKAARTARGRVCCSRCPLETKTRRQNSQERSLLKESPHATERKADSNRMDRI